MKATNLYFAFYVFLAVMSAIPATAQFEYTISLEPTAVDNLPGLHSYAVGQSDGKWLVIGGRKDGLHARQPFNAFPSSQSNTDIYVIDVEQNTFWSASVNSLSTGLKEQLQSTNMNFCQLEDSLYIIGGYGYSATSADHITYPYLTTVTVSSLIDAIVNGQNIAPYFSQVQHSDFAVTGGQLKHFDGAFYLVGGHRFDGRYNPRGNPTYTQTYTNQIQVFSVSNSSGALTYSKDTSITDAVHLHRRDYNLLPQIYPDGSKGLMISSGVFQVGVDLPYLYPVEITPNTFTPRTTFNQYLSNYHCATANLYDSSSQAMHSIFFGGLSQYYYDEGQLVQDDQVPFVKTISRLTRNSDNQLSEHPFDVDMPDFQGASAEFIGNKKLPHYTSEIIEIGNPAGDSILLGHIYGGIHSSARNPFSANQTNLTEANTTIYKVWLIPKTTGVQPTINGQNPYGITVYPNPSDNEVMFSFQLSKETTMRYMITNSLGQVVLQSENDIYRKGDHVIPLTLLNNNQHYFITVVFENKYFVSEKIIKN